MTETPKSNVDTWGQAWLPQVDNFSKELSDFLLDEKLTNKEQISKSQLNLLEKIFLDEDNKKFFAELIFYDIKLKKKKNHKLLTSSSFEDLSKILRLSLEHLTSNEYNTCRLLTISSFGENVTLLYVKLSFNFISSTILISSTIIGSL